MDPKDTIGVYQVDGNPVKAIIHSSRPFTPDCKAAFGMEHQHFGQLSNAINDLHLNFKTLRRWVTNNEFAFLHHLIKHSLTCGFGVGLHV